MRSAFDNEMAQIKKLRRSLSERTLSAGSERLAGRRRGALSLLPFAGPAIIVSVAYVDPGNFATNIQAGAKYNYNLLWVVLLANVVAMLVQALAAKLGIVTWPQFAGSLPRLLSAVDRLGHVDRQ